MRHEMRQEIRLNNRVWSGSGARQAGGHAGGRAEGTVAEAEAEAERNRKRSGAAKWQCENANGGLRLRRSGWLRLRVAGLRVGGKEWILYRRPTAAPRLWSADTQSDAAGAGAGDPQFRGRRGDGDERAV